MFSCDECCSRRWLSRTAFGLKLAGGVFIAGVGALLFWASLAGPAGLSQAG